MNKIMENVPLSTVGDEDRFRSIVNDAINTKQVKKFKLFETSNSDKDRNRRKREAEREAQEAEALAQELGLNHKKSKTSNQTETAEEEDQLKALIQSRQSSRMQGMLASLEEKYGGGGGKKGAKKGKGVEAAAPDLGPTDEEFEAIQAKLLKKNKVSVGKGKSKK